LHKTGRSGKFKQGGAKGNVVVEDGEQTKNRDDAFIISFPIYGGGYNF
jgi:hypothetical protein